MPDTPERFARQQIDVQLAARLARLDRELEPIQRQQIVTASGGHTPAMLAGALLRAFDPDEVEAASRRLLETEEHNRLKTIATFFDPTAPITITEANLPHWKQEGVTYFVTFRLVDSLPQERLQQWIGDRDHWLASHAQPLSEQDKTEYHTRFSAVLEQWLDQGAGSNVLELEECRTVVADALRHFDGQRYKLGEFVVASNHVHLIVTPLPGNELSDILHSWKSYTAKEIIKVEAASRRLQPWWDKLHERRLATAAKEDPSQYRAVTLQRPVWQKESFDHIVRSAARLQKFEQYIRDHRESGLSQLSSEEAGEKRRDAACSLGGTNSTSVV